MKVLGAILAGGKARRFGADKALALYNGVRLIDHVLAALRPQVDAVVTVGREFPELQSTPDRPGPDMGPLAGLAGALAFAQAGGFDAVISAGVDSLGLPADLVEQLSPAPAYLDIQPVVGLWPVSALPELDRILASDQRHSMLSFIGRIGARAVRLDVPPANINTAADLRKLEQLP